MCILLFGRSERDQSNQTTVSDRVVGPTLQHERWKECSCQPKGQDAIALALIPTSLCVTQLSLSALTATSHVLLQQNAAHYHPESVMFSQTRPPTILDCLHARIRAFAHSLCDAA